MLLELSLSSLVLYLETYQTEGLNPTSTRITSNLVIASIREELCWCRWHSHSRFAWDSKSRRVRDTRRWQKSPTYDSNFSARFGAQIGAWISIEHYSLFDSAHWRPVWHRRANNAPGFDCLTVADLVLFLTLREWKPVLQGSSGRHGMTWDRVRHFVSMISFRWSLCRWMASYRWGERRSRSLSSTRRPWSRRAAWKESPAPRTSYCLVGARAFRSPSRCSLRNRSLLS